MGNRRNAEGYFDPTASDAVARIIREERRPYKTFVFICSPFAGNMEGNARRAREYCRFAVARRCIPIAPHLYFPQFMDEGDPKQRSLGIFFGLLLQSRCREVWVFGGRITKGMEIELEKAAVRDLTVRYFIEDGSRTERLFREVGIEAFLLPEQEVGRK